VELLKPLDDAAFAAQTASYSGTAGSTTGWPAGPQGVVVWSTTAAYIRVGVAATATTADTPIPANTPIPFAVPGGTGAPWRVSAIQVTGGGTVYAKPINIQ
jgi:hypothetical protein